MQLASLVSYLDEYLAVAATPDYAAAWNGLQAEGKDEVRRIAFAVDACLYTIEETVRAGADMLFVHHGLFWGAEPPIVGRYKGRIAPLVMNGVSLYSSHLPLDVHPEVGNNHVLARQLGLTPDGGFAEFKGMNVGVLCDVDEEFGSFADRVARLLSVEPLRIATGPSRLKRVAIMTGGGGSAIADAKAAGADVLLTGEGNHHSYFEAEELGINVLYAGHYATETVGVKAIARHLTDRFGLETLYIDHPTGL